jgi:hypothetical protein
MRSNTGGRKAGTERNTQRGMGRGRATISNVHGTCSERAPLPISTRVCRTHQRYWEDRHNYRDVLMSEVPVGRRRPRLPRSRNWAPYQLSSPVNLATLHLRWRKMRSQRRPPEDRQRHLRVSVITNASPRPSRPPIEPMAERHHPARRRVRLKAQRRWSVLQRAMQSLRPLTMRVRTATALWR